MGEHPSWQNNGCPPGEPIKGETYRADGWAYVDFPKCTQVVWGNILAAIGAENFVPLSMANYGHSARGQLIISPSGMTSLSEWLKSEKAA